MKEINEQIWKAVTALNIPNHIRNGDEIFEYVLEHTYQLMPLPFRLIVKESVYKQFCLDKKDRIKSFYRQDTGVRPDAV